MKNLQRVAIVGFASAGMALFGSAAMADTYHSRHAEVATPKGAAVFGLVAGTDDERDHHKGHGHGRKGHDHDGKAFYKKWGAIADHHGAANWGKFSYAD